jgi:hypothetical protein
VNVKQINFLKATIVEVAIKDVRTINTNRLWEIIRLGDDVFITSESEIFEINPTTQSYQDDLNLVITRGLSRLVSVEVTSKLKNEAVLSIFEFQEKYYTEFSIGIPDKLAEALSKVIGRRNLSIDDQIKWLVEHTTIEKSKDLRVIILGKHIQSHDEKDSGFIIAGNSVFLQVNKMVKQNQDGVPYNVLILEKITRSIKKENYVFTLCEGSLDFTDETTVAVLKRETQAALAQQEDSITSYLNIWNKYSLEEEKIYLERMYRVGYVEYESFEQEDDKVTRLSLKPNQAIEGFADDTSQGDLLEITTVEPGFLNISIPDIKAYSSFTKANKLNCFVVKLARKIRERDYAIYVESEEKIPMAGFIFLSIRGDRTIQERRNKARYLIDNLSNPMPQLKALLQGAPVTKPQQNHYDPISPGVKEEIFPKYDPTYQQRKAIEIALNTPDIAIIQGPPGTGKTTVITAILKRLNEISSAEKGIAGSNLVTAFQHDAVENAVDRIYILGLPAVKFGTKSGANTTDVELIKRRIDEWRLDKANQIRAHNPELSDKPYLSEISDMMIGYKLSPGTAEETGIFLKELLHKCSGMISPETLSGLMGVITSLELEMKATDNLERNLLLKQVRRIPTNIKAFNDGGSNQIKLALLRISELNSTDLQDMMIELSNLAKINKPDNETLLELKHVREKLLLKLSITRNPYAKPKNRDGILEILNCIAIEVSAYENKLHSPEQRVLLEYLNSFENYPVTIQEAVEDYTSVYGATCQQTFGEEIVKRKADNLVYENVLIDEAARSNPLDMFIPMSVAKSRIILVGDHRQLPHMVDQQIEERLKNELKGANNGETDLSEFIDESIKKSLFEHLISIAKKLQEKDGIPRTITLNEQYRMHPVLGDYVSREFYECHRDTTILSPLPADGFSHSIPGLENKAAVWLDIPLNMGAECISKSRSISRQSEAQAIAKHLKQILDNPKQELLSYGVITFYSEQVSQIRESLTDVGILSKEYENYVVSDEYIPKIKWGTMGLRIGSVDAFQGMEFDVVYLSMVRSNPAGNVGFLQSENRLCVAMSRQKKMLIAVGDSTMLSKPKAQKSIRQLCNFYELCKTEALYGSVIQL